MTDAGDGGRPRSIGEVLDLLKGEFPDITISKIRFLEGQGLLDIERTPSGYRKFHDDDVARLRWILRQQREHFLPLRVIRERLAHSGGEVPSTPADVDLTEAEAEAEAQDEPRPEPQHAVVGAPAQAAAPEPAPRPAAPERAAPAAPAAAPAEERPTSVPPEVDVDVVLTAEELAGAAGVDLDLLRELERFGLVTGKRVAGAVAYDRDALDVARAAGGFARHGLQARHLRAYLTAAQREAGLYEQLALPLARQRTPGARRAAAARLDELVDLGASLRTALLRSSLREHFGP